MEINYSIIIPTYNEENTIQKAILQWSSYRENIEIIVSDGLSTDGTIRVAEQYDVKIIQANSPQKSIAEARNLGATIAKNEWLIFLDSDVRIRNVKKFLNKINSKSKEFDAATIRIKIIPEEEKHQDRLFHFIIYLSVRFLFFMGSAGGRGECQIIKRFVFEKLGGYNESFVGGEDFDMMRQAKKRGFRVCFLHNLIGYESPRHYRKSGYLKVLLLWFVNWFSTFFLKRSVSSKWEKVR